MTAQIIIFGPDPYSMEAKEYTDPAPITIGFAGGDVNLYGYVSGNPLNFMDPSGEVEWEGTSYQAAGSFGIGISYIEYRLTSEWVNNERAKVRVIVAGPTIGTRGAAGTKSKVKFRDYEDSITPSVFQPNSWGGLAVIHQGSAVGGAGVTASKTKLGRAWSIGVLGSAEGFDIGATILYGSSTLWDVEWETRGCHD